MPSSITGNKGEWSEMYVLLRLLADGKIYAADENARKIKSVFFSVLKIIRDETKTKHCEYAIDKDVEIYLNGKLIKRVDRKTIQNEANYLYSQILSEKGRAFTVKQTEAFMSDLECSRLAAPSSDKTDIQMQIHDIHTGYISDCGFSIKSEVGNAPTLINASGATNFIFEVSGLTEKQIRD